MKGHGLCNEFCPLVPLPREINPVDTLPLYCFKIQEFFLPAGAHYLYLTLPDILHDQCWARL